MENKRRKAYVWLFAVFVFAACSSTPSSDPEPLAVETPPSFEDPTAVPTSEPIEPAASAVVVPELSDDERIAAAAEQLIETDLQNPELGPGTVLDAGLLTDEIVVEGGTVTIRTCTWRSSNIRPNTHTFRYSVSPTLDATQLEARTNGPACMNDAIIESAADFAIEFVGVWAELLGPEGDPNDPRIAEYWQEGRVSDTRQARERTIAGFRDLLHWPEPSAGFPVAWAHHKSPIEFVIAIRWEYDDRYAWYDRRTGERLVDRSPQKAPDDLVGDDHVVPFVLWWSNERWQFFTGEDLYAINCTTPDCVETLHSLGRPPGRGVNSAVDFPSLEYTGIPK